MCGLDYIMQECQWTIITRMITIVYFIMQTLTEQNDIHNELFKRNWQPTTENGTLNNEQTQLHTWHPGLEQVNITFETNIKIICQSDNLVAAFSLTVNHSIFSRTKSTTGKTSKHMKCSESPCGLAVAYAEGGHPPNGSTKGARKKCSQWS